ncbi:S26 family signal peptidase [Novipirellula maiorica]|nr:S26 family signal peptidase [Rhodopirellula maiorica]
MRLGIFVLGAAVAIAIWSGLANRPQQQIFRVSGFSMAPTLHGDYQILSCPECRMRTKVAAEAATQLTTFAGNVQCWHCGAKFQCDGSVIDPRVFAGDLVELTPIESSAGEFTTRQSNARESTATGLAATEHAAGERLRVGDIVALQIDGRMRVKRILGLPGDTISLQERRLLVNGRRLEIILAEAGETRDAAFIDVDIDPQRSVSRWSYGTEETDSAWLVYHHQSVYEHSRPSEIYDDYPCNVGVVRRLNPIDQLAVTFSLPVAAAVDVAFYCDEATRIVTRYCDANESLTITVGQAKLAESISLTRKTPIAIRVGSNPTQRDPIPNRQGQRVRLNDLCVRRSIEYRLRRRDSDANYPLTLKHDECFIVGDNVPTSVDSRELGPLPLDNIVGIACRVTPP